MQNHRKFAHLGVFYALLMLAALVLLAAPAAQAFTFGGETAGGDTSYQVPKFDLEEQAKNFRSGGSDATTPGKPDLNTPFGKGTLQFGVQQRPPGFGFGPSSGPMTGTRANRADFERMLTPDNLR